MSDPPSQIQGSQNRPGLRMVTDGRRRSAWSMRSWRRSSPWPHSLLFYRLTLPHGPDDVWLTPWFLAPIVGPMVFQLISRPRPKMRYGLAFAGLLAVVFGVWAGIQVPFKEPGGWPLAHRLGIVGYIFVTTFIGGLLGAAIAHVLTGVVGATEHGRRARYIVVHRCRGCGDQSRGPRLGKEAPVSVWYAELRSPPHSGLLDQSSGKRCNFAMFLEVGFGV